MYQKDNLREIPRLQFCWYQSFLS